MRNRASAFLRTRIQPGDQVIAAVSGGKDSMALLHVLRDLAPELGFSLSAAHFNHALRGRESQRDEGFVTDLCARWGIPLSVGHGDAAKFARQEHLGIEDAARRLRYDFLLSLSDSAWIATAHTAGDNAETLLMHLIRGCGLHGLTGIPPQRGRVLRPLLEVSPQEIADYLSAWDIPHVEDSTNALDDCFRNRLRHHVLPLLEQENPRLTQSLSQLCTTLRLEDAYLTRQAQDALESLLSGGVLDCGALLALPEALQYRVLGLFLSSVPQCSRTHLEQAKRLCGAASPSASLSLPGGFALVRVYHGVQLLPPGSAPPPQPVSLSPGEALHFGPWLVSCRRCRRPQTLDPGVLALPAGTAPVTLRIRKPGDRISLSGGTKKLSRLMMDEKVPARWRDSLPVVCRDGTILAVLPLKAAACCRLEAGADCLLLSAVRMEDQNESGSGICHVYAGGNPPESL